MTFYDTIRFLKWSLSIRHGVVRLGVNACIYNFIACTGNVIMYTFRENDPNCNSDNLVMHAVITQRYDVISDIGNSYWVGLR